MRYAMLVVLLLVPITLISGCAVLDWISGVDSNGKDKEGPSPVESASGLLNIILPGLGGLATGLAGVYVAVRRGAKWKQVAVEGMDAVESVGNTPVGQQIKARLKQVHVVKKLVKLVKPIVDGYGHTVKAA